jgi:hypothetical protein
LEDQKNLILSSNSWLNEEYGNHLDDKDKVDDDDDADFEEEKIKLNPVDIFNAEDMLVEKQSFTSLDFRVHHLEKSIFGFDPIAKKTIEKNIDVNNNKKNSEQISLLKKVDEIKKEFNTIIRERDGADSLKSFLEIYDQVSDLVSPFKNSALAMERVILTPEAKAEIIVSSAQELEQVADNLKQIDELQSVIDAPEFKGLDKYLPEITPIEGKHIDQAARTNQVSARMTQLLDRYNGIVNTLSEIFISWDSILSTIDTNITEIERINEK